jgi:hypothetical protein
MIRRTALLIAFYALMADTPPATFVDIAGAAGLKDVIVSGGMPKKYVLEVNGSGACWLDYDNDGLLDLYLVNGSTIAALQGKTRPPGSNHLYRNNGNRTFTEVTAKAGVPGRGWGFGCVAADYDNDGFADLFVSNFGENVLYRNRGDGTFADVTRQAGVGGGEIWHAGAAFGDYDRDGDLDLFVPGYLAFDIKHPELKTCEYQGVKVNACGPVGYIGAPDLLFRNNGDGSFTDVTSAARVTDAKLYFGFQAVFEDFDNDGWPDLFVGNDSNPNYFYRNRKDGTFEEMGVRSGVALNVDGKEMSSMGVAVGDYDHDGLMDLFVTTFAADNYVLFHNDGKGFFSDVSFESGVGEPTVPYLGWATGFLDYDNDGHLDLFCANGHVYPEVTGVLQETFLQPLQLLRNVGNGKFRDVSGAAGLASLPAMSARGGAIADFDNDGDLDIVVSILDGRPVLLENKSENTNWLRLRLTGAKSNRMGVGARVKVVAGGVTQYSSLRAGESYLSSNDPRLHFGLGTATEADVEITWPDGRVQSLGRVRGNREIAIQEPR